MFATHINYYLYTFASCIPPIILEDRYLIATLMCRSIKSFVTLPQYFSVMLRANYFIVAYLNGIHSSLRATISLFIVYYLSQQNYYSLVSFGIYASELI